MERFQDSVVAITGAASGIGRALAVEVAARGADVAISDIDEEGLAEAADQARRKGAEVLTTTVDVADREAVHQWADEVVEHFGRVNVIVNNAGVSVTAAIDELSYEDFEWLMDINFWGVVYGTKAFLPYLRAADKGHIVNISSVFGIIGHPSQAAYNAAKFAVRGFTESVRAELELEESSVSATSVHPGGVKTNIVRASRVEGTGVLDRTAEELIEEFDTELARLTPEEAACQILDAVQKNKRRVLVGRDAQLIDLIQRCVPSSYMTGLVKILRSRYVEEPATGRDQ